MKPPTKAELNRALYGKKNKFSAKRTNGYASKHEANVAAQLHALLRGGRIAELAEQVRFELLPADGRERPVVYVADFTYLDHQGKFIVADAKGWRTPVYKLKKRMMWHLRGIRITEF